MTGRLNVFKRIWAPATGGSPVPRSSGGYEHVHLKWTSGFDPGIRTVGLSN